MQALIIIPALVALIAASGDPRQPLAARIKAVIDHMNATTQILLSIAQRGGSARTQAQAIWTRAESAMSSIMRFTTLLTSPGATAPTFTQSAQQMLNTFEDVARRYRDQVLTLKRATSGGRAPAPRPSPAPAPTPDAPAPAADEGGVLSRIPWWGWMLGALGVGGAAYYFATSGEEDQAG